MIDLAALGSLIVFGWVAVALVQSRDPGVGQLVAFGGSAGMLLACLVLIAVLQLRGRPEAESKPEEEPK